MMKATIDRSGCIGCALCIETCPQVFGMGNDGSAEVIATPTTETIEAAKAAEDGCPVGVITVEK